MSSQLGTVYATKRRRRNGKRWAIIFSLIYQEFLRERNETKKKVNLYLISYDRFGIKRRIMCVLQNVNQIETRLCKLYTPLMRCLSPILFIITSDFQLIFLLSYDCDVIDQKLSFTRKLYGFCEWHLMGLTWQ